MTKQMAAKTGAKPASLQSTKMEPLQAVPRDEASIAEWLRRFNALPLHQRSKLIKESAVLSSASYSDIAIEGRLLLGPLMAEANQDQASAEDTYLTVLKPLRDHLISEYQVQTAAEFMLVDVVVLSYYQCIRAARSLFRYSAFGKSYDFETLARHAHGYLIRANEMFLRNLEALRQMKAAPFTIKIEHAGQVNVGREQVNMAARPGPEVAEVVCIDAPGTDRGTRPEALRTVDT